MQCTTAHREGQYRRQAVTEREASPEAVRLWVDTKRAKGWLLALLVAVVVADAIGACEGAERAVAYGSAAAGVFAAVFAILIYSWTARAVAATEQGSEERHQELLEKFTERAKDAPSSELEAEEGDEAAVETLPEEAEADERDGDEIGPIDIVINGVTLRAVPLGNVPIKVLGDLYKHWVRQGHTGRWDLGRLVEVRRKPGRGNNPYLLLFRSGSGESPDDFELWRVSYGGQGKTEPSVESY